MFRNVVVFVIALSFGLGHAFPQYPKRVRVGGQVQQKKLVHQSPPVYPPLARQARIQGTVRLEAVINQTGSVDSLKVIGGHPLLVQAGLDAVRHWQYQPTFLNGEPVEVVTTIDINFALDGQVYAGMLPPDTPPLSADESDERIRVAAAIASGWLTYQVQPEYPLVAGQAGIQGAVRLEVSISKTGTVENVRPLSGPPQLHRAAEDAVKQWQFRPALLNGQEVTVLTTLEVNIGPKGSQLTADATGARSRAGRIGVPSLLQRRLLLREVEPEYPSLAHRARLRGVVQLQLLVGRDGLVQDARVLSGHPALVRPSLEAVRHWVYQPSQLNGEPVEVLTIVNISNWQLSRRYRRP